MCSEAEHCSWDVRSLTMYPTNIVKALKCEFVHYGLDNISQFDALHTRPLYASVSTGSH